MSVAIEWTADLPCPMALPTGSYVRRAGQSRPFLARPTQQDRHQFQEVTFAPMNYATATALRTFWREDLAFGGNWFFAPTWSRPQGAGGVRRFIGPLDFRYIPGTGMGYWSASGTVEVRGAGMEPVRPNASAYWLQNDYVDLGLNSSGLGDVPWVFSNGDRTVYVPDDAGGFGNHYQGSVYSNLPQGTLKRYFEIVVGNVEDGGSPNQFAYGFVSENQTQSGAATFLGTGESWCLAKDGAGQSRYIGNDGAGGTDLVGGLPNIIPGTVLGFAIDQPNRKAWISIDDVWLLSGDPGAGTNPIAESMPGSIYNPAFAAQRGLVSATLRSVEADFTGTIPAGFIEWADVDA